MATTVKLYSYDYFSTKTYLFALLFVAGNMLLPQIAHFVPNGGPTLLPIYFFTLIASYKYGYKVGLLTAILSPLLNSLFFGMPPFAALPAILVKSSILALTAGFVAKKSGKINLLNLVLVILSYQLVGTLFEWAWVQDLHIAIQDFRIGLPGMLIQLLGGYALLKGLAKL